MGRPHGGFSSRRLGRYLALGLGVCAGLSLAPGRPAFAWSPETHLAVAQEAAKFAPPDLRRQIDRHQADFRQGVLEASRSAPDGGTLQDAIAREAERAADSIRQHQPFSEIVRRLGIAAYWVGVANDPLRVSNTDPEEGRYEADYSRYVDSARPRFALTFYGEGRNVESHDELEAMLTSTLARSRELYGFLGREYARIDYGSGVQMFDDRSTAFGVSALSQSHAASDIIAVLRYVWLSSGGADRREFLSLTAPVTSTKAAAR